MEGHVKKLAGTKFTTLKYLTTNIYVLQVATCDACQRLIGKLLIPYTSTFTMVPIGIDFVGPISLSPIMVFTNTHTVLLPDKQLELQCIVQGKSLYYNVCVKYA